MKTLHRPSGFTLVELMIAVVIVGVLAAIALTAYQRNVTETRRKAATACLIEGAQAMERFYTTNLTYVGAEGRIDDLACSDELSTFYTFESDSVTARAFFVVATAQGQQADRDSACSPLRLDQSGQRWIGTTRGGGQCW